MGKLGQFWASLDKFGKFGQVWTSLDKFGQVSTSFDKFVKLSKKITYNIFKNKSQRVFGVNYVMKGNNVVVFELFEKGSLADGGERRSFLFLQSYLFQRHNLECQTENENN